MPKLLRCLRPLLLLAYLSFAPVAHAAPGYDACTDFIASLPATIATPGTWCLTSDLSTSITGGAAITIDSSDVTLDCNGFRIDGSGAGVGTMTVGIAAFGRRNITVRRCEIRTFHTGVRFTEEDPDTSDGHLVEDNLVNINRYAGIDLHGDSSLVRRNRVHKTGLGVTGLFEAVAIRTTGSVDVLDNTVAVVEADTVDGTVYGIDVVDNPDGSVRGNRVRGVHDNGTGDARALRIVVSDVTSRVTVRGNILAGNGIAADIGLECVAGVGGGLPTVHAKNNTIHGFGTPHVGCTDDGNVLRQ